MMHGAKVYAGPLVTRPSSSSSAAGGSNAPADSRLMAEHQRRHQPTAAPTPAAAAARGSVAVAASNHQPRRTSALPGNQQQQRLAPGGSSSLHDEPPRTYAPPPPASVASHGLVSEVPRSSPAAALAAIESHVAEMVVRQAKELDAAVATALNTAGLGSDLHRLPASSPAVKGILEMRQFAAMLQQEVVRNYSSSEKHAVAVAVRKTTIDALREELKAIRKQHAAALAAASSSHSLPRDDGLSPRHPSSSHPTAFMASPPSASRATDDADRDAMKHSLLRQLDQIGALQRSNGDLHARIESLIDERNTWQRIANERAQDVAALRDQLGAALAATRQQPSRKERSGASSSTGVDTDSLSSSSEDNTVQQGSHGVSALGRPKGAGADHHAATTPLAPHFDAIDTSAAQAQLLSRLRNLSAAIRRAAPPS